ncbi:hypothetical protein B9Z55_012000 [Caenorhabditis nigoni]|uniref:Uncharacterized protein n=1 Tax=Caenorhabditis nigoni TaxID=1611254 RepID=A0A2G5TVF4_9PELO|nr:hypothetical protein B9Z55_012000 [Caenorhabditis nigoni]
MSLNVLDLEELHTPETRTEECEVKERNKGNGFTFRSYFVTFVAFQFAVLFLILGLTNYKKCSAVPRIRIWMILVGALLCLERGIAIRRLISKSIFDKEDVELSDHEACYRRETKRRQLKSRPVSQDFIWLLLVVLSMLSLTWLLNKPNSGSCDDIVFISVMLFSGIILLSCFLAVFYVCICFCCRKFCCCAKK